MTELFYFQTTRPTHCDRNWQSATRSFSLERCEAGRKQPTPTTTTRPPEETQLWWSHKHSVYFGTLLIFNCIFIFILKLKCVISAPLASSDGIAKIRTIFSLAQTLTPMEAYYKKANRNFVRIARYTVNSELWDISLQFWEKGRISCILEFIFCSSENKSLIYLFHFLTIQTPRIASLCLPTARKKLWIVRIKICNYLLHFSYKAETSFYILPILLVSKNDSPALNSHHWLAWCCCVSMLGTNISML